MKNSIAGLILIAILFLTSCVSFAQHLHHEADYQKTWCSQKGGITEYVLPDKASVDCLLDDYAVQMDFAEKWGESIGQALLYSNETGRAPGVVLIMENPEKDYKYLVRLLKGIEESPKHWRVWIMEPGDLAEYNALNK